MFDHLLVPLDRSALAECVLPHVAAMAKTFGSRITLLHIVEPLKIGSKLQPVDPLQWAMLKTIAQKYLGELVNKLQGLGLEAKAVIREGNAAASIVTYAHQNDVDLIFLSSHGQSGLSRWTLSSVAQKIIMQAATSIMLVRAYQANPDPDAETAIRYRCILVPLDGSQRAGHVLPAVDALASHCDASVQLVHVVRKPEMPRHISHTDEEEELVKRVMILNRPCAEAYLAQCQSRLSVDSKLRLMESDDVTTALHGLTSQLDADLIILNAHGYSGSAKWPYGSVATSFIMYCEVPLLLIQDFTKDKIIPTRAQLVAQEQVGH